LLYFVRAIAKKNIPVALFIFDQLSK